MKLLITIALCLCISSTSLHTKNIKRPESFYQEVAQRIWRNESNCSFEKLVWWNEGECFMSLGIGHFLWFPKECTASFTQTFPQLLTFMKQQGQQLPAWLAKVHYCPWTKREQIINNTTDERLHTLRVLLHNTIALQAQFIVHRFETAYPTLLAAAPRPERTLLKKYITTLSQTPEGLYALIDYVNFKGEGTNPQERYHAQGWGLLQVLTAIDNTTFARNPHEAFKAAAQKILTQRVNNAPPERNEQRWLAGWINRVNRYFS